MDLKNQLALIMSYYENLNIINGFPIKIDDLKEQKANLEDLELVFQEFSNYGSIFNNAELFDTTDTQNKLMDIHKFLTDLSWHISELQELNVRMIKLRISNLE